MRYEVGGYRCELGDAAAGECFEGLRRSSCCASLDFGGDGDLKSDRGEGTANENLREKLLLFRWPSPWLLEDDCDQRLGLPVYSPVLLLEFDSLFDGDAW